MSAAKKGAPHAAPHKRAAVHGPSEVKRGAYAALGGGLVAGVGLLALAFLNAPKKTTTTPATTGQAAPCADCTGQRNPAKVYG